MAALPLSHIPPFHPFIPLRASLFPSAALPPSQISFIKITSLLQMNSYWATYQKTILFESIWKINNHSKNKQLHYNIMNDASSPAQTRTRPKSWQLDILSVRRPGTVLRGSRFTMCALVVHGLVVIAKLLPIILISFWWSPQEAPKITFPKRSWLQPSSPRFNQVFQK